MWGPLCGGGLACWVWPLTPGCVVVLVVAAGTVLGAAGQLGTAGNWSVWRVDRQGR